MTRYRITHTPHTNQHTPQYNRPPVTTEHETRADLISEMRAHGVPGHQPWIFQRGWYEFGGDTWKWEEIQDEPAPAERQFCRKCQASSAPAVTLTFDGGARRLHWCAEHVEDAERYRPTSDQAEPATLAEELDAELAWETVKVSDQLMNAEPAPPKLTEPQARMLAEYDYAVRNGTWGPRPARRQSSELRSRLCDRGLLAGRDSWPYYEVSDLGAAALRQWETARATVKNFPPNRPARCPNGCTGTLDWVMDTYHCSKCGDEWPE